MNITPTVIGQATIKGESVLIVAAGENAESLQFAYVPLAEHSADAYTQAFVQGCKDLGFGEDGKKKPEAIGLPEGIDVNFDDIKQGDKVFSCDNEEFSLDRVEENKYFFVPVGNEPEEVVGDEGQQSENA